MQILGFRFNCPRIWLVPLSWATVRGALLTAFGFFFTVVLSKGAVTTEGLVYEINQGTISITGYSGGGGDVKIPSSISGFPVVAVGDNSFNNGSSQKIRSIALPETVVRLGGGALRCGDLLANISVDSRNPEFVASSDGSSLFSKDQATLIQVVQAFPSVVYNVPASVRSIVAGAFVSCDKITNVNIPASVSFIGMEEPANFYACQNLQEITVDGANPNYSSVGGVLMDKLQQKIIRYPTGRGGSYVVPPGIVVIGMRSFASSRLLSQVILLTTVGSIEDRAFFNCGGLISAQLGAGLKSIGSQAFFGCDTLDSLALPASLTSVGASALSGTRSLREIMVDPANASFSSLDGVLLNKTKTGLVLYPNGKGSAYIVPKGVTSVGTAFSNTNIEAIFLPESVSAIAASAFSSCNDLRSLVCEGRPPSIQSSAFSVSSVCTIYYTASAPGWSASLAGRPAAVFVPPALSNLSVRVALTSGEALIVGAVVGSGSKTVLIRAAGPALNQFGLNGMSDPRVELFGVGADAIGSNDDWSSTLQATFASVGAFPFASFSKDAAILQAVSGPFTVQTRGSAAGVVLCEVYDVGGGSSPRLINVSSRNRVGTGSDILIAGFAINGVGPKKILVRAVGPTLGGFGVTGALADPSLTLLDSRGVKVAANDNWDASLAATFNQVGAFALLPGSRDAAIVATLAAGASYTAQVSGVNNSTGEALIEIYEVP